MLCSVECGPDCRAVVDIRNDVTRFLMRKTRYAAGRACWRRSGGANRAGGVSPEGHRADYPAVDRGVEQRLAPASDKMAGPISGGGTSARWRPMRVRSFTHRTFKRTFRITQRSRQ